MILLNRWIGTMIARREREAARFAQHHLDDRELQDIGIHRSQIADDLAAITRTRLRRSRRS